MGKKTPERKMRGKIMSWTTNWKPCWERIRVATRIPRPDRDRDRMRTSGMSLRITRGVREIPTIGAMTSMTAPCTMAVKEPPAALPMTMPTLLRGATRTSLRKPNSRSQTTDIPAKRDDMTTVMAMMPGYMNCTKLTSPPPRSPMIRLKPAPKTTRNVRGKAKEENRRERSAMKRSISR